MYLIDFIYGFDSKCKKLLKIHCFSVWSIYVLLGKIN